MNFCFDVLGFVAMRSFLPLLAACALWLACAPATPPTSGGTGPSPESRPNDLTASEMRSYEGYLHRFPSPCGGDDTIAICLENQGSCNACSAAASFVARSVRSGFVAAEVEERYRARFDPTRVVTINTREAPSLGPKGAAVTIVEFADFQCPFCAAAVPIVDDLVKKYAPNVRVVFMHFPIKYHPFAEMSAHAAMAAHRQGKFWELHHLMFANRDRLDRPDIEKYARSLNLDMAAFLRDWDSEQTAAAVRADYEQGNQADVRGTPAFFINGRPFDFDLFDFGGEDLLSWIELEIKLAQGKASGR